MIFIRLFQSDLSVFGDLDLIQSFFFLGKIVDYQRLDIC